MPPPLRFAALLAVLPDIVERASDSCEDVADVLHGVVLKYA